MKLSEQVKSISYLKTNTAKIIRDLSANQSAIIITQNGEAKAILQDLKGYEKNQETLALLKILALGQQEIELGKTKPAKQAFTELKKNSTWKNKV
ncbi:MAG: type II toxin-antitoxin system Phd/YefM family antitoxin [Methylococcales bacterium]|nr:type II toxin-antitoxin system Phd/YefM family antitoxin [Methylococcales bacterium]MBT7410856.1 type II toxin-antitoxin system Phd/YefM family antitoxin [Methylococcales bacterium]